MAALDSDNYIKLFRLDDSRDSSHPENVVVIPAGKNVFRSIFHWESRGQQASATEETLSPNSFPEEGVNLLIKFRYELEELFQDCGDILGIAAVLWEDISRRLFERGFTLSGQQCATQWEAAHSKYLEVVQSDDEGRLSESKYFNAFENIYKLRSKYIDSKILEDITEYLSSRSDSPSPGTRTSPDAAGNDEGISANQATRELTREDFSTLSNEDDTLMLMEAITAAQSILDENLRDFDHWTNEEAAPNARDVRETVDPVESKQSSLEASRSQNPGEERSVDEGETSLSLEHKKTDDISGGENTSKMMIHSPSTAKERGDDALASQVFVRSEKNHFYWNTDATQCFLDLRLYVETNKKTKLSVLRIYKSIVRFISQKMLQNGFQVSEIDCRKKWDQLMRYYNREIQKMKTKPVNQNRLQGVRTYFWQMDKVLKKWGLETNNRRDFVWDQQSIRRLIAIRMPMENAFSMFKRYIILWQYVASQMQKHNFLLTYNECSIKWMEIFEIYKICLDSISQGVKEEDIGWIFYHDMRQGFELNAKSTEAVVNYRCDVGAVDHTIIGTEREEKSVQSSANCASFCGSETASETQLDALRGIEDLNMETRSNPPHLQMGDGKNTSETAIRHCNILENMIKGAEVNTTNNMLGVSKAPDSPQIENNVKIKPLEDLYLLDSRSKLEVRPEHSEASCIKMPAFSSPKFEEVSGVKNGFRKKDEMVEATVCSQTQSLWTDKATTLLIKFKISRELKFRSLSSLEMDLWKEIAADMQSAGHNVCHESCSTRWQQLMQAFKDDPSPENDPIISPKYREQLRLIELPFIKNTSTAEAPNAKGEHQIISSKCREPLKLIELPLARNSSTAEAPRAKGNEVDSNCKATKFVWTDDAVKNLIELKFSEEIRNVKKYGLPLAKKMQAAGFSTIAPIDASRKWARLYLMYKKSYVRKMTGQLVTWRYFELIDNYMAGLTSGDKPQTQRSTPRFSWTPEAAQKLINHRLLMENSCQRLNHQELILLWRRIAEAMVAEGFQVTYHECATKWEFLVKAYMKTKRELRTGTGAVIGDYFKMMNKALNQLNKWSIKKEATEGPIDFCIRRKQSEPEDSGPKDSANIYRSSGTMSPKGNTNTTVNVNVPKKTEHDKSVRSLDENVVDLSLKISVPPLNCTTVDSSSEIKELPDSKIRVSSSEDSSQVSSLNKEKHLLPMLIFTSDKSQQEEVRVFIYEEAHNNTDKITVNDDQVDSSKKNVVCIGNETRNKAPTTASVSREDTQSKISSIQKPCNQMTRTDTTTNNLLSWSEAGTNHLIDLKLEYNRKFVGCLRPKINWYEVAAQLVRLGYYYTSEECAEKWYSLKATYKEKIADIQAKRTVQTWPYFGKMDSFYKNLGNLYPGFRYILPKKRPHSGGDEQFLSPKKFVVYTKSGESSQSNKFS